MKIFKVAIFLLIISSCAKPLVTNNDRGSYRFDKRYFTSIPETPVINDILRVNVALLPLPDEPKLGVIKPKNFFDLRDSIPHTFLRIIGEKADSIPQIIEAIQSDLSKIPVPRPASTSTNGAKAFRDDVKDEVKVRLLISSVARYYYDEHLLHPNTRIEQLSTDIKLTGNNFTIKTIDRLENDLELIDLGTLDRKNEVRFVSDLKGEAGVGAAVSQTSNRANTDSNGTGSNSTNSTSDSEGLNKEGNISSNENKGEVKTSENRTVDISKKAGVTAALKYENSSTINEGLKLQYQRIKTSFSFSDKNLTVTQASAPNKNIAENVYMTLTLKSTRSGSDQKDYLNAKKLFKDDSGTINGINDAGLEVVSLRYIPCYSANINLSIQSEGMIRSVKNQVRGRNRGEFDDKVIYLPFQTLADTIDIPVWNLGVCTQLYSMKMFFPDSLGNPTENRLYVQVQGDKPTLALFHEDNVSDFREWFFRALGDPGQNLVLNNQIVLLLEDQKSGVKKLLTSRSLLDITCAKQFFKSIKSIEAVPYPEKGGISNIRSIARGQ
ncbi:hypothetical protein [Algoriphagus antarcticus]|uniref:Uncharacterized protein n=1 Tax=Algoriphagus antarcticus TaxID=238540 RepID=A0A3E0D6C7_9BACT|nr:hypothetical protein [Algoriphagus antarcticus]REG78229.1 hypothetical protein C8N25_13923 [Algoriphagus antarcticus]